VKGGRALAMMNKLKKLIFSQVFVLTLLSSLENMFWPPCVLGGYVIAVVIYKECSIYVT
jgi:hypothetical protein